MLGGVSLFGGRGSVIGVAFGVLFISILSNGLNLLNVPSYTQMMVIGGALILAVSLDQTFIGSESANEVDASVILNPNRRNQMQSRLPAKSRLATFAAAGALALLAANPASAAEKIGVSMPNIKGPWFTPVLYEISDEAKKLGYDVTIQDAGGYANVDKQVSQFSNLVVQKVAAILIDPANPASFNGAVKRRRPIKFP